MASWFCDTSSDGQLEGPQTRHSVTIEFRIEFQKNQSTTFTLISSCSYSRLCTTADTDTGLLKDCGCCVCATLTTNFFYFQDCTFLCQWIQLNSLFLKDLNCLLSLQGCRSQSCYHNSDFNSSFAPFCSVGTMTARRSMWVSTLRFREKHCRWGSKRRHDLKKPANSAQKSGVVSILCRA